MRKVIKTEHGTVEIIGSGKDVPIDYEKPDWSEDEEQYFLYKGDKYFLSEFPRTKDNPWGNAPKWAQEYDGIKVEAYSSGLVVNLTNDGDSVKAYCFIVRDEVESELFLNK